MEGSAEGETQGQKERVCILGFQVVSEMGGVIPTCPEVLMKNLPGVGRYTAGGCGLWVEPC